jgi:hypothetical protein
VVFTAGAFPKEGAMADGDPLRKLFAGAGMAALRQGFKEAGTALKAFPDSISVDEPGTVASPTQGEIAEQNRGGTIWGRVQTAQERLAERSETPPERGIERD